MPAVREFDVSSDNFGNSSLRTTGKGLTYVLRLEVASTGTREEEQGCGVDFCFPNAIKNPACFHYPFVVWPVPS